MNKKAVTFVRCLKCQKILQCSRYDTTTLVQHIRTDHPEVEILNSDSKDEMQNTKNGQKSKPGKRGKTKLNESTETQSSSRTGVMTQERSQQSKDQKEESARLCECTDDRRIKEMTVNCTSYQKSGKDLQNGSAKCYNQEEDSYYMDRDDVPESDTTHYTIKSELMAKYPEIKNSEFCSRNSSANVIYTKRYKLRTASTTSAVSPPQTPQKRNMYRATIEKWRPANGTIYCPQCGCNKRPLIKSRTENITENQCFACFLFSCWPFCCMPCLIPDYELEYLHCSNCKTFLGLYNRNLNCIKPNREYTTCNNEKVGDSPNIKSNAAAKNDTDNSSAVGSQKSNRKSNLPSIVIDGKELHPDMVARLQRFRKYGHLAGIDLDAVTTDEHSPNNMDSFRDGAPGYKHTSSGGRETHHESF